MSRAKSHGRRRHGCRYSFLLACRTRSAQVARDENEDFLYRSAGAGACVSCADAQSDSGPKQLATRPAF